VLADGEHLHARCPACGRELDTLAGATDGPSLEAGQQAAQALSHAIRMIESRNERGDVCKHLLLAQNPTTETHPDPASGDEESANNDGKHTEKRRRSAKENLQILKRRPS
jgi:hypothetical protein